MVEEKETRARETMCIMGLQPWALNAAWAATYAVILAIVSLTVCNDQKHINACLMSIAPSVCLLGGPRSSGFRKPERTVPCVLNTAHQSALTDAICLQVAVVCKLSFLPRTDTR